MTQTINGKSALATLQSQHELRDVVVTDELSLPLDTIPHPITCVNCTFDVFSAFSIEMSQPFRLINCQFAGINIYSGYFIGGFEMRDCRVTGKTYLCHGGHNQAPFVIAETTFESFVDFEDQWFMGRFVLSNVTFASGTNLLGNQTAPVRVSFDTPPEFSGVTGKLDIDS